MFFIVRHTRLEGIRGYSKFRLGHSIFSTPDQIIRAYLAGPIPRATRYGTLLDLLIYSLEVVSKKKKRHENVWDDSQGQFCRVTSWHEFPISRVSVSLKAVFRTGKHCYTKCQGSWRQLAAWTGISLADLLLLGPGIFKALATNDFSTESIQPSSCHPDLSIYDHDTRAWRPPLDHDFTICPITEAAVVKYESGAQANNIKSGPFNPY